nr:zinc finger CCCH domain-containing protein 49-like [Tanacetum cinerariifolium]
MLALVRDTALSINSNDAIPKSDVNREYFAEEHDRRSVHHGLKYAIYSALDSMLCDYSTGQVGLQVYLKSISNSEIVAKGWIRSLDLDEVHQLLGLALLFRWCARMIDDGRWMMT